MNKLVRFQQMSYVSNRLSSMSHFPVAVSMGYI